MTNATPAITLNNGVQMPVLGFGVYQIPPSMPSRQSPRRSLPAIARSTAAAYQNEKAVGRAIADCGIPRDELFVTTKL